MAVGTGILRRKCFIPLINPPAGRGVLAREKASISVKICRLQPVLYKKTGRMRADLSGRSFGYRTILRGCKPYRRSQEARAIIHKFRPPDNRKPAALSVLRATVSQFCWGARFRGRCNQCFPAAGRAIPASTAPSRRVSPACAAPASPPRPCERRLPGFAVPDPLG